MGLGFAISGLAFLVGATAIVLKLAGALPPVSGWASLTVIVSFFSGIQLIVLATVGLYVGRAYEQGKQRPLYLLAETRGFTPEPDRPGPPVPTRASDPQHGA
jgi:dolichol-phosphate mannosyltransferase